MTNIKNAKTQTADVIIHCVNQIPVKMSLRFKALARSQALNQRPTGPFPQRRAATHLNIVGVVETTTDFGTKDTVRVDVENRFKTRDKPCSGQATGLDFKSI